MTHSSDQCPNVCVIPESSLLCHNIILLISALWEDLERPGGGGREVWAAPRRQYGQNCYNILITGMGMPVDASATALILEMNTDRRKLPLHPVAQAWYLFLNTMETGI